MKGLALIVVMALAALIGLAIAPGSPQTAAEVVSVRDARPMSGVFTAADLAPSSRTCDDVVLQRQLAKSLGPQGLARLRDMVLATQKRSLFGPILWPSFSPSGPLPTDIRIWASAADFSPGRFWRTEIVSGTDRISLAPSWTTSTRVNDDESSTFQGHPSLAIGPKGILFAIWRDDRNGNSDICSCQSRDGGASWTANTKVSDDVTGAPQDWPDVAVDAQGNLYVVWLDGRLGEPTIFFARSDNGGLDWSKNVQVNEQAGKPSALARPTIAVDLAGQVLVAWEDLRNGDSDIFFARSPDGGLTWEGDVRVNDDSTSRPQINPSLAVDIVGKLYLAWRDDRNGPQVPDPDIYFARSDDGGRTWSPNVRVNDDKSGRLQDKPSLAVDGRSRLYLAWRDDRNGESVPDPDIYFARSVDGGETWSANVRVNGDDPGAVQDNPSLAVDREGVLSVVWRDDRSGGKQVNNSNIYFARSFDHGQTWMVQEPVNAPSVAAPRDWPSLVVDGEGKAFAIWQDSRASNSDVYSAAWPQPHAFATQGLYTSPVLDAVHVATWDTLTWTAQLPPDTAVILAARSGTRFPAGIDWSGWYTFTEPPVALAGLPRGQLFQWRALLATAITSTTPIVDMVSLSYAVCYDLDFSSRVDLIDIQTVAAHFGLSDNDLGYERRLDLNQDGWIDVLDIVRVAKQWRQICP